MSLATQITALATRVGTEFKTVRTEVAAVDAKIPQRVIKLPVGTAIPGGTPAGTIIVRYVP